MKRPSSSGVLADAIATWLAAQALTETEAPALFEQLCQRLFASGMPIMRANVSYNVLHPLYAASALSWTAAGVEVEHFAHTGSIGASEAFLRSPFNYLLSNNLPLLRRRLSGPEALVDFPVLEELRQRGGHDYLLLRVSFGAAEGLRGIVCSWLCQRKTGFTDTEIAVLQRLTSRLAGALKARLERGIAHSLANTYLGSRAGDSVLSGAIHRGDGEKIEAALWYSDLRRSSTIADEQPVEVFLNLLNKYFEMTAGCIRAHGGEIVAFIGDAVLGFFRTEPDAEDACARAAAAALASRAKLAAFTPDPGLGEVDFGIGLHFGQVIYGNVGIADRLAFTLIGGAVNEVARLEDLSKALSHPIIASAAFTRNLPAPWQPLGQHHLRGIGQDVEVFAPPA
jgi:adenylate cyclase